MSSITLYDTTRSVSAAPEAPVERRRRPAPRVRLRRVRPATCVREAGSAAYGSYVLPAAPERAYPLVTATVRLTHRGRAVVLGALVAAAMTAVVVSSTASTATTGGSVAGQSAGQPAGESAGQSGAPVATTTVTVEPGQSMWEIARAVAPGTDPRVTITRIVDLNELSSAAAIRAGQRLTVPLG